MAEKKQHDSDSVTNLTETIRVTVVPKSITRIGRIDPDKTNQKRPMKVVFNSEEEKDKLMANLRNLKDVEQFKGVSITDDYTIKERQLLKEKAAEAKVSNGKEPPNSKYIWRVRGTPKNGLTIKKLLKERSAAPAAARRT